jgi:hypothetical protein
MGDEIRFRPSRMIAPLLATAVILLLGTAFCIAIVLAFGEAKPVPIAVASGSMLAFALLLWSWRDRPRAEKRGWFTWVMSRNRSGEQASYKLAVIRSKHHYGQNRPPTLESLRELKDPTRTWVPRKGHGGASPQDEVGD